MEEHKIKKNFQRKLSSPFGRMHPHTKISSDFRRGELREKKGEHLEHRRNKCKKGGEERIQVKKRSFSFVSFLFGKSDGGSIVLQPLAARACRPGPC